MYPIAMKLIRLVVIGLFASGLIFLIGFLISAIIREPYYSSPTKPREWHRNEFERVTIPSSYSRLPMPTLDDAGALPAFEIDYSSSKEPFVAFSHDLGGGFFDSCDFDIFEANKNNEVVLPGGLKLILNALAVSLPHEIPGLSEDSNAQVGGRAEWLDPIIFKTLGGKEPWQNSKVVAYGMPTLHLHVKNKDQIPVRFFGPEIRDSTTMARVSGNAGYRTDGFDGHFSIQLRSWHASDLLIAIPFVYGNPEYGEMQLSLGEEVVFGRRAKLKLITQVPGHLESSGYSMPGLEIGELGDYEFTFRKKVSRLRKASPTDRSLGIFVWPPSNTPMIEYRNPGDGLWSSNHYGTGGFSLIRQKWDAAKEAAPTLQIRRFPNRGKAIYRIPKLPGFPETENLFSTPIPKVLISHPSELLRLITAATQTRANIYDRNGHLRHHEFPMTMKDTTPLEMLRKFEELSKTSVLFDETEMTLSEISSEPFLKRWQNQIIKWSNMYIP